LKINSTSNFVDDAMDLVSKVSANAHEKTIQKIKEDGRPIEQIEKFLDTRIKNDPILVRQILRVCFSAYTNNPINLGVLAPTSEGKTYATVQVTNLFPTKDMITVARLSPTALIHQNGVLIDENGDEIGERSEKLFFDIMKARKGKDKELSRELEAEYQELKANAKNMVDLTHKILLFLDNPNPATYEMLKPLLSHDKHELLYKTTTGDGSLRVKETILRGWPAAIVCSAKNEAKNEVWPEIQSRFFITSPNTDVKKYKAANKLTADIMGVPTWAAHIHTNSKDREYSKFFVAKLKEYIITLCQDDNNPIYNPYRQKIVELLPNTQGIDMRHFARINAFCNIETILHAKENMKIEFITNQGIRHVSVITSLENIDKSTEFLGVISTLAPDKVNFFQKVVKELLMENLDSYGNVKLQVKLTSRQLADKYAEKFDKPTTPKKIVENYLEPLVDEGMLESEPNPDNKKQNFYSLGADLTIHNLSDLKSTIIESIDNHPLFIWLGIAKLGRLSRQNGKLTKIFDKDGTLNFIDFNKKIL